MRYSKSFIPTQAFNPCTWCYNESNFATEDEYQKSVCFRCDNNFCKFTNAMWKYKRRNHYLQKIGRIKRKLFPCSIPHWKNTEQLPF